MNGLINGKCLEANAVTNVINGQVELDDMMIESFPTMHDANEPCCYKITTSDDRKAMIATDLGVMTDVIRDAFTVLMLWYLKATMMLICLRMVFILTI